MLSDSFKGVRIMNADHDDKINVPKWTWIIMAVAFLLITSAAWWASSASSPGIAKVDVSSNPMTDSRRHTPLLPNNAMDEPSSQAFAPDPGSMPPAKVYVSPMIPNSSVRPVNPQATVKQRVAPKVVVRRPVNKVHDMFPMGNVVDNLPHEQHIFRTPPELFPSFSYAGKLWSFGGTFAYAGQVDLATIGYRVGDRDIYALANTQGPGRVLFVQSGSDPNKFAIYR